MFSSIYEKFLWKNLYFSLLRKYLLYKTKVDFLRGYAIVNIGRNNSVNRVWKHGWMASRHPERWSWQKRHAAFAVSRYTRCIPTRLCPHPFRNDWCCSVLFINYTDRVSRRNRGWFKHWRSFASGSIQVSLPVSYRKKSTGCVLCALRKRSAKNTAFSGWQNEGEGTVQ